MVRRVVIVVLVLVGGMVGSTNASQGQLEIINKADDMPQNCIYTMDHWSGSSEGYVSGAPDYDTDYNPLWTPSGFKTKLISEVEGHELEYDSRPLDNNYVGLELSLHDKEGDPIIVTSNNYLEFTVDPQGNGYDFGNKPITLQQYDPCDPNACYPEYDVRKAINLNGGVIPLPNLNGTYNSEEPYAYFKLAFDKYHTDLNGDQKINFQDFAIFANDYGRTGITDANRADPNDLEAYADYDMDSDIDTGDLHIFTERWLWDANDPNTW